MLGATLLTDYDPEKAEYDKQGRLIGRPCFTVREVSLRFPGFNDRQLHYWQRKGWVRQLRRPYYRITERPWTLHERQAVANTVYAPSYISLESARVRSALFVERDR